MTKFKKNGFKIFLGCFCAAFVCTLLVHFLPAIVDFYAYSNITITKDNVSKACGSDMWKIALDKFDYIEIKYTSLKQTADYGKGFHSDVYINFGENKDDYINKYIQVRDFIFDYLSEHKKCEINKFSSAYFVFGQSNYPPQSIKYYNEYKGESLDGFEYVQIKSDDNDFLSIDDIVNFDTRFMLVDVPLDKNTDLSMLGSLKNVEELRLKVDDKISEEIKAKIKNMALDYQIILI